MLKTVIVAAYYLIVKKESNGRPKYYHLGEAQNVRRGQLKEVQKNMKICIFFGFIDSIRDAESNMK